MTIKKKIVEIKNYRVNLSEATGKPLILLLRMASQDMGIWDTIWPEFAKHFTVANFELINRPAMDQMDRPGEVFRRLAENCVEVADGLGFEKFHLFGWFGGTQVALHCLVGHSSNLYSAILLNPFYRLPDMRKIEKGIEFKKRIFEQGDRRLYSLYWLMGGFTPDFLEKNFDRIEELAEARAGKDRFVKSNTENWLKWVHALRTNWLTDEQLEKIPTPTLVIGTALDNWHAGPSAEMARVLASKMPAARLQIMDNAGSFIMIEDPDRFMKIVFPFILEVTQGES